MPRGTVIRIIEWLVTALYVGSAVLIFIGSAAGYYLFVVCSVLVFVKAIRDWRRRRFAKHFAKLSR